MTSNGGDASTILDRAACLRLLSDVEVGRIAWCACDGRAVVVPVAFVLDGDAIVVRTIGESRVRAVRSGRQLTFEADDVGPSPHIGWSVLVKGSAEVVDDHRAIRRLTVPSSWTDDPASTLVRITPSKVTGYHLSL